LVCPRTPLDMEPAGRHPDHTERRVRRNEIGTFPRKEKQGNWALSAREIRKVGQRARERRETADCGWPSRSIDPLGNAKFSDLRKTVRRSRRDARSSRAEDRSLLATDSANVSRLREVVSRYCGTPGTHWQLGPQRIGDTSIVAVSHYREQSWLAPRGHRICGKPARLDKSNAWEN